MLSTIVKFDEGGENNEQQQGEDSQGPYSSKLSASALMGASRASRLTL